MPGRRTLDATQNESIKKRVENGELISKAIDYPTRTYKIYKQHRDEICDFLNQLTADMCKALAKLSRKVTAGYYAVKDIFMD